MEPITPSSENVFEDLGFSKGEAVQLRLKSFVLATLQEALDDTIVSSKSSISVWSLDHLLEIAVEHGVKIYYNPDNEDGLRLYLDPK